MRNTLCHEEKIIRTLLRTRDFKIPRYVDRCLYGKDSILLNSFVLNETFTVFFSERKDRKELSLVGTDLALPLTIGNETYLVADKLTNQIEYLEYMGPILPEIKVLLPYLEAFKDVVEITFTGLAYQLALDLVDGLINKKLQFGILKYARFLIFQNTICFFLSTSLDNSIFCSTQKNEISIKDGHAQLLFSENDMAVDGWVDISIN